MNFFTKKMGGGGGGVFDFGDEGGGVIDGWTVEQAQAYLPLQLLRSSKKLGT